MPRFYSIIENEAYRIGCTGQTVWVLDKNGTVLAKFKDLIYVDRAAISPLGHIFVVKNTVGQLAVYSLETLSLIKKFRFSKVNGAQDDGFCFSADGKYFLNVERQNDDLHSAISVYDAADFSLLSRTVLGDDMAVEHIQEIDGEYYALGFDRDADLVIKSGFVAKFKDHEIFDKVQITDSEHDFYWKHLHQTCSANGQKIKAVHTLRDLWTFYRKKQS